MIQVPIILLEFEFKEEEPVCTLGSDTPDTYLGIYIVLQLHSFQFVVLISRSKTDCNVCTYVSILAISVAVIDEFGGAKDSGAKDGFYHPP